MATLSKDNWKAIRTCLQIIVIIAAIVFIVTLFTERGEPPVFDRSGWTQRDGFTAISYTSLTRKDTYDQNSRGQFAEHIKALKEAGYNWITVDDIINFYTHNQPLPEKALYLMLEGGRKESVIFGQEIIGAASVHASLFTHTNTLSSWGGFFVTYSNISAIDKSPFWDVGSQGYRLERINENIPGVEPGYSLTDLIRDPSGRVIETEDQAFTRLDEYYEKSFSMLAEHMASPLKAYIFMPANVLGVYMPGGLEDINKRLIKKYFKMAFTREGPAFNSSLDQVYGLSRMQVNPQWSPDQLLNALDSWSFNRKQFVMNGLASADEWSSMHTVVEVEEDNLVLVPSEGFVDPAILRGSSTWEDVNVSVTFNDKSNVERYIFLRYASKDSYVRLTLRGNRLEVHQRLPGTGLVLTYDSVLPVSEPWNFDIRLKGNRLRINLNGSTLEPGLLPVEQSVMRGSVAIGSAPVAGHMAYFDKLKAESLPTIWKMEEAGKVLPPENTEYGLITTRILPISAGGEYKAELARNLMQTAAEGNMVIAALPKGSLEFDPANLVVPPFDAKQVATLWGGVAICPAADADWKKVEQTLKNIDKNNYYSVIQLSLEAARALALSGNVVSADYFLFDFAAEAIEPSLWTALARRHNRNRFLYAIPGTQKEQFNLYTARGN